jgi:hypothetical protein
MKREAGNACLLKRGNQRHFERPTGPLMQRPAGLCDGWLVVLTWHCVHCLGLLGICLTFFAWVSIRHTAAGRALREQGQQPLCCSN